MGLFHWNIMSTATPGHPWPRSQPQDMQQPAFDSTVSNMYPHPRNELLLFRRTLLAKNSYFGGFSHTSSSEMLMVVIQGLN
jgi:hypothetical protein